MCRKGSPVFQFYLSSIKSIVSLLIGICLASFNSTLVQLKAINVLYSSAAICCFNSTLVQLKAERRDDCNKPDLVSILP